jgi:hypothetical protein
VTVVVCKLGSEAAIEIFEGAAKAMKMPDAALVEIHIKEESGMLSIRFQSLSQRTR